MIGYVLCGFTNFSATGNVLRYPIAVKVFGRAAVDAAIQRVRNVLLGWGYSVPRIDHHLTKLICALLLTNRSPRLEDLTIERLAQVHDELPSWTWPDDRGLFVTFDAPAPALDEARAHVTSRIPHVHRIAVSTASAGEREPPLPHYSS